jgi:hypothetical protein
MLPPCTAVKHPRPGVPDAAYDCERAGALVQHHLKDGAAAGGGQLAGHERFGIRRWPAGRSPHRSGIRRWPARSVTPPLGPVAAAQPAALGVPFWLLPAPVTTTTTSSGSNGGSRAAAYQVATTARLSYPPTIRAARTGG